ncbi:MAG: diaminopimelate epimerase [Candidatus Melainabacteria bacterium]|nr:diaminopimelate epimerase [Candidatus Melainabacteria bacterium]
MNISFTKMHGLGNDFVLLTEDGLPSEWRDSLPLLAKTLCDRHFGIGADGLILAARSHQPDCDIRFVYLNGDGSWAEMCGNGIRCFARYVLDRGLVKQPAFKAETLAGIIASEVLADGQVRVDMGPPILEPAAIPFQFDFTEALPWVNVPLRANNQTIPATPVSMGNPHCIVFQQDLAEPLEPAVWGPILEHHPAFPAKTNVEFVEVIDQHTVRVVVWERGCGFTLACGTGACATAVAACLSNKTASRVAVHLPGGPLDIFWDRQGEQHVWMTGPASYVFEGVLALPEPEQLTKSQKTSHVALF